MFRRRHISQIAKAAGDLVILGMCFCLAFLVRFEGVVPPPYAEILVHYLPFVALGKLLVLAGGGRLRMAWRYTSLGDALRIFGCLGVATALLLIWCVLRRLGMPGPAYLGETALPFGVVLLDLALSFLGIIGVRIAFRLRSENEERRSSACAEVPRIPTLLIGAGRAGAMVANEIATRPESGIQPVGFLDDDRSLRGMSVGGISVLGTTADLNAIAAKHNVQQVLITIANRSGVSIRRIAALCKASGLITKIIPPLHDIVAGKINLSRIRQIAIEDLLRRTPISLDCEKVQEIVTGKTVLVTGAGGSIGSELCRLIADLAPNTLVLAEKAENNLFHTHRHLVEMFPKLRLVPAIADICDESRMDFLFGRYRPSVIFHAAAHKHVPMMEWNPGEAVKNNVLGTRTIATLADAWKVERFVMISTDKAVNPTSVMGVSKRVSELFIQGLSQKSGSRFMTVRFGNVLGSAGSVIPIFQRQIASGGPVTVTHPEMKRYFMTIPEACQLVLQAAAMGKGGELFILDMGEPVRIVDLARDLIRLSGLAPDHDVEIRFTGLRPGEKLFEQLSLDEEQALKTQHPRIFIGKVKAPNFLWVNRLVDDLGELAAEGDTDVSKIYAKFKEIVPEYRSTLIRHDAGTSAILAGPHENNTPKYAS